MKSRFLLIVLFSIVSIDFSFAQKPDAIAEQDKRFQAEFMIVPTLVYNSISLGLSKPISKNVEQAINFSTCLVIAGGAFLSFALRYNYNITVTNRKKVTSYVPFWLGSRYLFHSESGEEGSSPTESMFYSIGSGYGMKIFFRNKHTLRIEAGAGVALNTIRNYQAQESSSNSFAVDRNYPVLPSLRLSVRYLIPLGKSQIK